MGIKDFFSKKHSSTPEGPKIRALSLLPPEIAFKQGFAGAAVAGIFRTEAPNDTSPENFAPNAAFIETLHRVVRERGPTAKDFAEAARRQGQGSLVIVDLRTPGGPNGKVPPEDIVGAFGVSNGNASSASYQANPNYRIYTRNGICRLPEPLHTFLVEELKRLTILQSDG